MDSTKEGKTYASPTLARYGTVIAKTEAGYPRPPMENDFTGQRV